MKGLLFTAVLILTFSFISCNNENLTGIPLQKNTSDVSIGLSMKTAASGITRIEGILSRERYDTLFTNFIIAGDTATGRFNNVPAGLWHLQVNAYNMDTLKYTGSSNVEVYAGVTTPVSLTLVPSNGSIDITVTWGSTGVNLISNPSFEFNGEPSLSGWTIFDTAFAKVVQGGAPGEGNWSLQLFQGGPIYLGGLASTIVTGQSGSSNYTLSFWEKNFERMFYGVVFIRQIRKGSIIYSVQVNADTTSWALFSKTIHLNMQPTDSLKISLQSVNPVVVAAEPEKTDTVSYGTLFDGISIVKN